MIGGGCRFLPEILGHIDQHSWKTPTSNRYSLVAPQPLHLAKKSSIITNRKTTTSVMGVCVASYGSWSVLNAEKKIGPFLGSSIRPNLVLIRPCVPMPVIVFVERLRVRVRGHMSVFVSVDMCCGDVIVQCNGDVIVIKFVTTRCAWVSLCRLQSTDDWGNDLCDSYGENDHTEPSPLIYRDHNNRGEASIWLALSNALCNMCFWPSVMYPKWTGIAYTLRTMALKYRVTCRYAKTLFFKVVLTNRVFDYKWQQQTQHVARNLGRVSNTYLKPLQQQLDWRWALQVVASDEGH